MQIQYIIKDTYLPTNKFDENKINIVTKIYFNIYQSHIYHSPQSLYILFIYVI